MAIKAVARSPRLSSEINVTPLVDVCLVLLIIFMLVTPLLPDTGVPVPETRTPRPILERPTQLTVTLEHDGSILLERTALSETDLARELSLIHAADPERQVVIAADRRLDYGRVRQVIRRVREAGFERVGLITARAGRAKAV
jgi:biopolymer transport protein TolR